ncbi:MAG: aryl-alcohol dehydrogenase-like predicted oxidoreductase/enamine deaminase RidA [Myxococcota bacterium]|jgi:aryl-alcohol dehydrogenase-like predicted oxidoreductase/enamine deaminase RidA (YjgF/YER057c/UK114 family)
MSSTVERCELAPGFTISRVLTGLWQIADMEREGNALDLREAASAMRPYVEAGFTTFDMADHYGSAEEIVGLFREEAGRDAAQLLTKWVPKPGAATREDVREAVQRSLDRMRSDSLDLLQFHAWNYADPTWLDCLFWLQELKNEGLIRNLGLTNTDAPHLAIALHSGIDIVSNQVCYSLLDQRPKGELTELCLKHGVKLLAFGTVAGGFLTQRWLDVPEPDIAGLETWSQMKYKRFIDAAGGWEAYQSVLQCLNRVAQRLDVSIANLACRMIMDAPAVGGVIIGARLGKSRHLEDNMRLFKTAIDESSRAEVERALEALQPVPGKSGDEYRRPPFLTASGDLSHHLDSMPPAYEAHSGSDGRTRVLTGTTWEDIGGFSRAVEDGGRIYISGTTATHGSRPIGGDDPAAQTHFVIDKVEGALQSLGASLRDVVRTRVFIQRESDWEAVTRAHGDRFKDIQPANTLVQAGIIGDEYLVEMEVEALVRS